MARADTEMLLAHADAVEHAASLGGWVSDTDGARRTLSSAERAAWARDAAVLREAAYQMEESDVHHQAA